MRVPYTSPILGREEKVAVKRVLSSGMIAQGEVVAEFEEAFARYCGAKNAVAVNSGTAALHCSLHACGIGPGDEVITTPFTFVATANAILMVGATPVFVDTDPETYNIDPSKTEARVTGKTRAILPVDLYGQVYDVPAIAKIAKKHNLLVVEDACQAHGAEYKGKKTGTFGDIACFSFYATKNMTTAEGGMVVTDNKVYAKALRSFRHHGSILGSPAYGGLGYNYRLTNIAAAIGIEQLKKLDYFNQVRMRNAALLTDGLTGIKGIETPYIRDGCKHVFHQYTIRVTKDFKLTRDELLEHLKRNEITTAVFYPSPLHAHLHLSGEESFPEAERASREVLSLPVHPLITRKQIDYMIEVISKV